MFQIGDRARVTKDLTREYFYPFNAGNSPDTIIIDKGQIGVVIEIYYKDGEAYDEICVSFSPVDGGLGCWNIHVSHLELVN